MFFSLFKLLGTFSHRVVQIGMFDIKNGTHHYLVYIIVVKWLESKTIDICMILRAKFRFQGLFSVLGTLSQKLFKSCLFATKNGTHHYLVYIILLKLLE